MKRSFAAFAAVLIAFLTAFSFSGAGVFAESDDAEELTFYSQDFEGFEASAGATEEFVFNDAKGNKPSGFSEFIGDGERSGAIISADRIGGSKSLRLMRYDGGVADMRITGLSLGALGEGSKISFSFKFMYKTLGNYGFSVLLAGIPQSSSVEDYGGGTRNIFSSGTDDETGKDVLYVVNPEGGSLVVTDELHPDTDYTVETVFTAGSDEFVIFLNGERIGEFKYIGKMTNVTAIRFDCHDWAEENDISRSQKGSSHVNEVYFDDIRLAATPKGQASEQGDKTYKFRNGEYCFFDDFEIVYPENEYEQPNDVSGTFSYNGELPFLISTGTPFVNSASYIMTTDSDSDFEGTAIAAKDFLDMRFWMILAPDDVEADLFVYFTVKVKDLKGCFDLCVTNRTEETTFTDSTDRGGMVIRLEPLQDDKIAVMNASRQYVGTIEKDKAVTIGAAFFTDTQNYAIFLDGEMIKGSMSFYPETFYGISALRFDLEGAGSEVIFDDIFIEYGELAEAGEETETAAPSSSPEPTETAAEEPTEAPTEEPTAPAETAAQPTAETREDPTAEPSQNNGCGGIVSAALALPATGAAAMILARRKKKG
ncbi:MAG: hypothetical protein J6112_00600 [Clostridia bacterium]|nr:hypothetical protein [Clostridia bacterium]